MTTVTTPSSLALVPSLCLTAGIGAIEQMLCDDARQLAGAPSSTTAIA